MNILINASNLKLGGGVQVADSVFRELYKYANHQFVLVYSDALSSCVADVKHNSNISVVNYNLQVSLITLLTGREHFLDYLVVEKNITAVLTVFGPSLWRPKVIHLCGFARSQLLLADSPFWNKISILMKVKYVFRNILLWYLFNKSATIFYTENSFISQKLKVLYPKKNIFTVTNNYNQVFDFPEKWDKSIELPKFNGLTLLTISANYLHKNLSIIVPAIHYLCKYYPSLKFRFVLTINENEFEPLTDEDKEHILFLGPVEIDQCPFLYEQSDIMFLPTLLECFSANYAEAMKMNVPILTTDLGFARSLCGSAAFYYSPVSVMALSDAIYKLSNDKQLKRELILNGKKQLEIFDNYEERTKKIISIIELMISNSIK